MSIEQRARLLVTELGVSQAELQDRSGISKQVWSNAFRGKQRMNSSHIEFLCVEFSDYAMWLCTGEAKYGLAPQSAPLLAEFERIAEKYADALSHLEYMAAVSEFGAKDLSGLDSIDIASPMPSSRVDLKEEILIDLFAHDAQKVIKGDAGDGENPCVMVAEHFREKAIEKLLELEQRYNNKSANYLMLSRLLGEFLLPGTSSNVFTPILRSS